MRIISGQHRGRRLLSPADRGTRPITDRVKTSLFDRLEAAGRLDGASVLDLFAGTGSMGIESLSRGAGHVTFVERDREVVGRLNRNLEAIGQTAESRVLARDALAAGLIGTIADRRYGLIFCDPPYRLTQRQRDRSRVAAQIRRLAEVAEPGALLLLRTDDHTPGPETPGWDGPYTRVTGSMALHEYHRLEPSR